MGNTLAKIGAVVKNNRYKLRGWRLSVFLKMHGCKVGKGLKCVSWPMFRIPPNGNIKLGDNVTIGQDVTFEIAEKAKLELEDHVNLTKSVLLCANESIKVGKYALIAENVSIRDTDHGTGKEEPIIFQKSVSKEIEIGEDVWIGAYSIILKGADIQKGVVIGANSLVNHKSETIPYGIYAGSPIRKIGDRNE